MAFQVEIAKQFKATQGLKSPVRAAHGLPPLSPKNGFDVCLRAVIVFEDNQLGDRGWFVDTDSVEPQVNAVVAQLEGQVWTSLFDFRPTFEQVARWAYRQLKSDIDQLASIELNNLTLGVNTRYTGDN